MTDKVTKTDKSKLSGKTACYLLPCPFCGSTDVGVFHSPIGYFGWNTGCNECDASGPYVDDDLSKQDAIEAWNNRAVFSHSED